MSTSGKISRWIIHPPAKPQTWPSCTPPLRTGFLSYTTLIHALILRSLIIASFWNVVLTLVVGFMWYACCLCTTQVQKPCILGSGLLPFDLWWHSYQLYVVVHTCPSIFFCFYSCRKLEGIKTNAMIRGCFNVTPCSPWLSTTLSWYLFINQRGLEKSFGTWL